MKRRKLHFEIRTTPQTSIEFTRILIKMYSELKVIPKKDI